MSRFESGQLAKDRKTAETALSYRQEKAILALLQQPNMDAAAASAGVTPRTLRRWMRQKEFSYRYKHERSLQMEGVLEVLRSSAVDAVRVLISVSQSKTSTPASRVSAAAKLIEFNFKTTEIVALEKRICQLEEIARGKP